MSSSARGDDAVIVGSGINSLVCAALLARAGWSVRVLERNDVLGGAVATAELTLPGYRHDVFSCWHSSWLLGRAWAELGDELGALGLDYLNTTLPAATAFPDGGALLLLPEAEQSAAAFEREAAGDGTAWLELARGSRADVLSRELFQRDLDLQTLARFLLGASRLGRGGVNRLSSQLLESARDWLTRSFASERVRGLLAPWVLHAGLTPDAPGSAFAARLITLGKQRVGSPLPRGGGARLVEALAALVERHGGRLEVGCDVERVLVERGRARGVRLVGGVELAARRAVICNVTPTQLYRRLLETPDPAAAAAARRYRYGLAGMQIHYALAEPARWDGDERLDGVAVVHVSSGLDGVSRAVNEAVRGQLPAEPTLVVGQPLTVDPSRAPDGAGMLWVQVLELPWHVRGDATGALDTGDGRWSPSLRERVADRLQAQLARRIVNLESAARARSVLSPADLEAANINLCQGDPYSGAAGLDQSLFLRPFAEHVRHRTPVAGLWHIGASSHPGPGLAGSSGYLAATRLRGRSPLGAARAATDTRLRRR